MAESEPEILAFPGAEGYGRFAKGGRGGDVYHVTKLGDKGPGSLREGIETCEGPRTIVFEVSGTIRLLSQLEIDGVTGLTVAGQTAPGDGVTLSDQTFKIKNSSDVVVRYLRVRLGDESKTSADALAIGRCNNVILDHVTATWGIDGTMDAEYLSNFTLQWSMFGEALNASTHHEGNHAMLMSFRRTSGNISLHHNLLFSSRNRHPSLGGGKPEQCNSQAIFDFRNNVIYNWEGPCNLAVGVFNLVDNYYRPGPDTATGDKHLPIRPQVQVEGVTRGFLNGSVFEHKPAWTSDNSLAINWGMVEKDYPAVITREAFTLAEQPVAKADRPVTHTAAASYELVLDRAGDSQVRDAADQRVVTGVRDRSHRRIDSPSEVGGWPELVSGAAPVDEDRDGMADAWESENGLNPDDGNDRNGDREDDGYTNLEEYLNSIARW